MTCESLVAYRTRIEKIHRLLGIPVDYEQILGLPLQAEADELVSAGCDVFDRPQQLTRQALAQWQALCAAAAAEGIVLGLVSAFRSVDYQCRLIERKRERGQSLETILRVNAAPGYSEHHTGRALDLTTPGCEPLSEAFENTPAFAWLQQQAGHFGFVLSYPRDNPHALVYEPWHWKLV